MVYVMSDIHGNEARFRDMLKQIKFSEKDTLYILGDVVDRGDGGIRILRYIMKTPNIKMLLGNHELMMLNVLYYPIDEVDKFSKHFKSFARLNNWYSNGGAVTHNSIKHTRKEIRKEIFEFLDSLPLNIEVTVNDKNYVLVHAGITDNYIDKLSKYENVKQYAVWTRDSATAPVPNGKTMIFGHTPTWEFQEDEIMKICKWDDRIGIDCGCAYEGIGRLSCLRLDDMEEFYSDI